MIKVTLQQRQPVNDNYHFKSHCYSTYKFKFDLQSTLLYKDQTKFKSPLLDPSRTNANTYF